MQSIAVRSHVPLETTYRITGVRRWGASTWCGRDGITYQIFIVHIERHSAWS